MAASLAAFLIDRVARPAARCSTPTGSTPGRPCRKRRSDDSSVATSCRCAGSSGAGSRHGAVAAVLMPAILGARAIAVGRYRLAGHDSVPMCHSSIPETDLDVTVVDHPLAAARLSTMRDARTDNAAFRAALRELTLMLIYEASRTLQTEQVPIHTPVARTTATRLPNPPLLVPVLRAGLGMADQAHALIPESQMGFVGLARDEETLLPTPYMESLPESLAGRPVYVLDPMLATGGSMVHTIELLIARGATDVTAICALAAPEGLLTLAAARLPVRVVTASVDERLNDSGYIVPGLGDAGDRQFGAV